MQASNSSDKPSRKDLGNYLVIGGLLLQLIGFTFFMVVTGTFHLRIHHRPTAKSAVVQVPWLRYIHVLYIGSILIMIRSIYRVIEYIQGRDGYLMSHEVFFYVLDATVIFLVSMEFNIFHPSMIVSSRTKGELLLDSTDREANLPELYQSRANPNPLDGYLLVDQA